MEKKYQVFVSSTYDDLKGERDQVIKAVLEMGHIPVGMEMFSAADEEQWKIIQRQILESDYYIVVVANKYGSIGPDGKSYTEMEYDFAVKSLVPTLGFVLNDKAPWPSERNEKSTKARAALTAFKSKVKSKLVQFWDSKDDLHGKVSISLIKAITSNPRVGWVRSSEGVGPEVMKEITRLSSENSNLRNELEKIKAASIEKVDEIRDVVKILNKNDFKIRIRSTAKWEDAKNYKASLLEIFEAVAPNLQVENSLSEMAKNLALKVTECSGLIIPDTILGGTVATMT
ncbi:DUF4062 domain-containing protein [Aeromonas jandaei]|uniref:DUF4062 domain-containing protein n=1 Tax=Aeromonas jandaei TaxID=650 RepID=UPI00191E170E|nr:DUF4062 domain-containing protein [Aeromonas jandaei]MBL0608668.1 DUF4062 domain-containing protein [Aeromonas jandaei]